MTALNASFFISVGSKKEDTLFSTPNFWAAFFTHIPNMWFWLGKWNIITRQNPIYMTVFRYTKEPKQNIRNPCFG